MVYTSILRYCLDPHAASLPDNIESVDWLDLLSWAERQAIVWVVFNGIQQAGEVLDIPTETLFKWIGYASLIERQNRLLNKRCVELTEFLGQDGYKSCILKGQGNALMYPNPHWRTPGDIDVWVKPGERLKIREIIRYVRKKNPDAKACYHHVDYGVFNGVEVEIHYRPSFMFNPLYNYRLQKWFMVKGEGLMVELPDGEGSIPVPTMEFNIIFQLSHVYNHLLHEGIGLRQIIDYYYLLRKVQGSRFKVQGQLTVQGSTKSLDETLKYLGLNKIAEAMMWVLHEVLGLSDEYLIAPKNEKLGKILLSEILRGGNFGFYDAENRKANSALKKNIQRIKRDIRMVRYFPSECLWEPVFRVYHWFWRQWYN